MPVISENETELVPFEFARWYTIVVNAIGLKFLELTVFIILYEVN